MEAEEKIKDPQELKYRSLKDKFRRLTDPKYNPEIRDKSHKWVEIRKLEAKILRLEFEVRWLRDGYKRHENEITYILHPELVRIRPLVVWADKIDQILRHMKFAMTRAIGKNEVDKLFKVDH